MEEKRSFSINRVKPKIVFDKSFDLVKSLEVEDEGQILVKMKVDSIRMRMDEDGTERKGVTVIIQEAKAINQNQKRII